MVAVKRLYSGKIDVFGKIVFGLKDCILAKIPAKYSFITSLKMVLFVQKWLYSGKVVVIGKSGQKRLY